MVAQLSNYGDRHFINDSVVLLPSQARTATTNSATQSNTAAATFIPRGAHFILDVTAISLTPSIILSIQGFEGSEAAKFYDLLVSLPITTTGTYVYKIYPGIIALPNASASDLIPDQWRATTTHANADSMTYSLVAKLFL
jgi:hypothetical protein